MFLTNRYSGYNRHGEQSSAGEFLLVASHAGDTIPNPTPAGSVPRLERIYVCIRFARLVQLGHFMMGTVRVADTRVTLSGSYGNDGLPLDWDKLSDRARAQFVPLSDEQTIAFWHPEHPGHNGSGSEAPGLRAAVRELLKARLATRRRR